jgi:hypothetical protein
LHSFNTDVGHDDGLAQLVDLVRRRQLRGVVDVNEGAVGASDFVYDSGRARDELQLVFALEALLHDVHVQQAEKTDAESEPQGGRDFGLVMQRGVVQPQLRERVTKAFVVLGVDREDAGEDARLDLFESRQRRFGRPVLEGDGVTDRRTIDLFNTGDNEPHVSRRQALLHDGLGCETSEAVDLMTAASGKHPDFVACLERAVHHPDQ